MKSCCFLAEWWLLPDKSSSIIPARCAILAWSDWSRGWENRFGYRFYSISVFWCVIVAVCGWQLWYHIKTRLYYKTCTQTSSPNPETNPTKPIWHNSKEWYCCSRIKKLGLYYFYLQYISWCDNSSEQKLKSWYCDMFHIFLQVIRIGAKT